MSEILIDLDTEIKMKKRIDFKHNEKIYKLNIIISVSYIDFFQHNKDKLAKKELAMECICMSNKTFKPTIKELSRGQIFYILNKYISIYNISDCKVTTYYEFCDEIEKYVDKCMKETKKQAENFSKQISKTLESFTNFSSVINSIISSRIESTKAIDSIKQIMIPTFDFSQQIHGMFEATRNIFERFSDMKVIYYISEFDKLLINLGYPPVDLDISDITYLVAHKSSEDICNSIDSLIIKTYDIEYIDRIFEKWKTYDFLLKRINLFEDAIYAYKIEKYSLAIPLMFAQIEGIVAEFFNTDGTTNMNNYKKYIESILEDDKERTYNKITKSFFMNYVLDKFFYGDKIPKFSRHAILHGADIYFGTKVNSINLILTLDIIFECMDNMKKQKY